MTWLGRIGLAITGVAVAVAAGFVGYVLGRRALATKWVSDVNVKKIGAELDALERRFEQTAMDARESAHRRQDLEAQLEAAKKAGEVAREAIKRGTAGDVVRLSDRRKP